ncbi:MAG: TonB-dependent receptor [Flavobacteriaceae bacterium]
MKFYYCLYLLLLYPIITHSQSVLKGTVKDQSHQPVLANIYFHQIEKGAATDLEGNFTISNIPPGSYNVIISALGYETIALKLSFSENSTLEKDFTLNESAVEMEEVIISTPFHKLQSENVMKVERVTTDALTQNGAINLSQGIANIPGVSTIGTGNSIAKPVIRGLNANRVLTYSQGVRLENQQFGDEHGLGINGEGVESVEVIKGPASLLYGSDAIGGVLYLNPEGFAKPNTNQLKVNSGYFSNTAGITTSAVFKSSKEKLKFLIRGTRNSFADYETGATYRVTNSRSNEYDVKTGIRFQDTKFKSTLRYNFNRANIGLPEEIGMQSTSRDLLLPFQEVDNHIVSLENNVFLKNSTLDITAGYVFNDRREFEESADEAALRLQLKTFNYDVKYHLPEWGKFTTIVGAQGLFQKNENLGEEILIPDASVTDFGIFATTHYHLEDWDLQGGLRFDTRAIDTKAARNPTDIDYISALNKNFTSFNAALGAKYDFSKEFTGRLNFSSGFRAPNLAELTSNGIHEGTFRYEIGNPNLKNEQSFQTDLALEYRNEHWELFANGFLNAIDHYIFLSPNGEEIDETPVYHYLQFGAQLWGGEFGIHLHPHPFDWLHWESSFEMVKGELKDGGNLPLIPANELKNTLRVELADGKLLKKPFGFITLQNTFSQNNVSAFESPTEGYTLLSAGFGAEIAWKKAVVKWGVNTTNLTNEKYINHLSRLKADGILNPGRSINMNLALEL